MTAFLEIRWLHIALSFLPFVYFYLFVGEGEIGRMFVYVLITRANTGKPHWGNEGSTNLLSRKFLVFGFFPFFFPFSSRWFLLKEGTGIIRIIFSTLQLLWSLWKSVTGIDSGAWQKDIEIGRHTPTYRQGCLSWRKTFMITRRFSPQPAFVGWVQVRYCTVSQLQSVRAKMRWLLRSRQAIEKKWWENQF